MDMDREQYLLGRAALKTKIKALAFEQTRAKKCRRVIRKLKTTPEQVAAALKEGGYETPGSAPGHHECTLRRMQITAYLNLYANIRGKEPHKVPDWYYMYTYNMYVKEAQALFDQATKPVTA